MKLFCLTFINFYISRTVSNNFYILSTSTRSYLKLFRKSIRNGHADAIKPRRIIIRIIIKLASGVCDSHKYFKYFFFLSRLKLLFAMRNTSAKVMYSVSIFFCIYVYYQFSRIPSRNLVHGIIKHLREKRSGIICFSNIHS